MPKKMRIPSMFKSKEANHPWQWPSCNNLQTLSFRAAKADAIFKTVNSVFLEASEGLETQESLFTNSSECASNFSTDERSDEHNNNNNNDDDNSNGSEYLETVIREVRSSERLFFEPHETSSMILKEEKTSSPHAVALLPFKGGVALSLESEDPYLDFKKSMQEMVESHGLRDWERLEELLGWYLKMNGKMNHGFILGAFGDLLVGSSAIDSSTTSTAFCNSDLTSYSSADSCFSSPPSPLSAAVAGGDHDHTGIDQEGEHVTQTTLAVPSYLLDLKSTK